MKMLKKKEKELLDEQKRSILMNLDTLIRGPEWTDQIYTLGHETDEEGNPLYDYDYDLLCQRLEEWAKPLLGFIHRESNKL